MSDQSSGSQGGQGIVKVFGRRKGSELDEAPPTPEPEMSARETAIGLSADGEESPTATIVDLSDAPANVAADSPAAEADSPAAEADPPAAEADPPAAEADPPAAEADPPAEEADSPVDPNPLDDAPTPEMLLVLEDKVEEFTVLGYGRVTSEDLWIHLRGLRKNRPRNLHEVVNRLLCLQPQAYMNDTMRRSFAEPFDLNELLHPKHELSPPNPSRSVSDADERGRESGAPPHAWGD